MTPRQPPVRAVLERADRRWSLANDDEPIDAPRMDALVMAAERWFSEGPETAHANTRALLGRLLLAVTGEWDVDGDVPKQVSEALRQLRLVRAYLLSQNDAKGVA